MIDVSPDLIDTFVAASRRAGAMGLARCSSGNLSWRIDDERMLVTASKSWMADLRPDQVVVCRVADCEPLAGGRPSIETRFHAGILRARPEMDVVLHFQSSAATTLACSDLAGIDLDVIIEMPFYIGPVAVVPYLPPGSEELADAVIAAMTDHDMSQLRNHGQVTVGRDLDDAIQRAVFFELACDIVLRAGDRIRPLDAEAVEGLRGASGV
ncbi:class II aldolase/adducin family protein [bacterium]|nr:class II aldolase/adducin family protein [bacterium]